MSSLPPTGYNSRIIGKEELMAFSVCKEGHIVGCVNEKIGYASKPTVRTIKTCLDCRDKSDCPIPEFGYFEKEVDLMAYCPQCKSPDD
jgi:hypothetical protein